MYFSRIRIVALAFTAGAFSLSTAHASNYTETFEGATASNAGYYSGTIPNTALEVLSGPVYITPAGGTHGNALDLTSGWYAANFDYVNTHVGSTMVRSIEAFDLLAGYTYSFSFDYSRQLFSAGNGPFATSITASLGSHSVTYDDVAGFYYGANWQTSSSTWTQQTTELGAHIVFTATGPDGYSGMLVDNISSVGLPPAAPVPEPSTWALLLGGLGAMILLSKRAHF